MAHVIWGLWYETSPKIHVYLHVPSCCGWKGSIHNLPSWGAMAILRGMIFQPNVLGGVSEITSTCSIDSFQFSPKCYPENEIAFQKLKKSKISWSCGACHQTPLFCGPDPCPKNVKTLDTPLLRSKLFLQWMFRSIKELNHVQLAHLIQMPLPMDCFNNTLKLDVFFWRNYL